MAKNKLTLGLAIEVIVQTTGLSLSDIEKLNNPRLNDKECADE